MELVRVNARKNLLYGDYEAVHICAVECAYNLGMLVGQDAANLLKYNMHDLLSKFAQYLSQTPCPDSAIKICNLIDHITTI